MKAGNNPNAEQSIYNFVTIQNQDTEPFLIEYNVSDLLNGFRKELAPQEIITVPKFIADHAVRHMIDQILNRMEKPTNNIALRQEWAGKIVLDEKRVDMPSALTKEQQAIEKSKEYSRPSDLDTLLQKRNEKPADVVVSTPAPLSMGAPVEPATEEFVGLKEDRTILPEDNDDAPVDPAPVEVTREQLMAHATTKMGMNFDGVDGQKTKTALDNMSISELKEELQYE